MVGLYSVEDYFKITVNDKVIIKTFMYRLFYL